MKGQVYWLTGLSGAGKTTIGKALVRALKREKVNAILLDGDEIRAVLGIKGSFSYEDRKSLAFTYSKLCKMLADQELDVVCATISMFDDVRGWNRQNIARYKEVFLRCNSNTLVERDIKGIYKKHKTGDIDNVAGFDLKVEEPKQPDLVIDNNGSQTPDELAELITKLN